MSPTKERLGEIYIFSEAILWGLFPVITILSYNKISPLISLSASSLFATVFFAIILTIKNNWKEVQQGIALKDIIIASFFLGILYYLLYFFGLQRTNAGNSSIIALTEVFFSFLFFHVLRKDFIPKIHVIGAILMVIGALTVLFPNLHEFHIGDLLILMASFIAPFGNFFVQRARKVVSSESIMFTRSLISSIVLTTIAIFFHSSFSFLTIKSSLLLLAINGILLLGLAKVFWVEGIHRITVTKANALSSISPLLTLFFAWILLKSSPTLWQMVSFIPMFFGILLLSSKKKY